MNEKRLILKIENYNDKKIKHKFSSTAPNTIMKSKRKYFFNSSKLKFEQNILLSLLKKTHLKKHKQKITLSKFNSESYDKNNINTDDIKISYNINKKFRDLPVLSKFRNLTYEKMNSLIKSEDELTEPKQLNNINKNNNNYKSYDYLINKRKNLSLLKNNFINTKLFNNKYNNKNLYNNNDIFQLNSNQIFSKYNNTFSSVKNKSKKKIALTSNSFSNLKNKKEKNIFNTSLSNIKNIKLNKNNKIKKKIIIQKWLNSFTNSNKSIKRLRRDSKVDRLVFFIEKPKECFEENLLDKKPGDKYQLFKEQLVKHKNKLENIIKEIKLNQIKSEYLMKKYIYDLLSRKKTVY